MTSVPDSRRLRPFRVFLASLGVLVIGVAVFVFGVTMEATAAAPGIIVARGEIMVRCPASGLADLGNPVQPGDAVKPGQLLVTMRQGMSSVSVSAPAGAPLWLVIDVFVEPGQQAETGQRLVTLVPIDPETRRPRELLALLDVPEQHVADIEPGQTVRLSSNLYSDRIHGKFEAVIERVEPMGRPGEDGKRFFRAAAVVKETPLRLLLGSGVKAEIVVGKKRVWRIILEH